MSIKIIEYNGISGYARVMYDDVKEADKYHTEVAYDGKDVKALLEYLFELEQEIERLKGLCDKYEEEHKTTFEEWKKTINIIKEVREYIETLNEYGIGKNAKKELLEILDKENK